MELNNTENNLKSVTTLTYVVTKDGEKESTNLNLNSFTTTKNSFFLSKVLLTKLPMMNHSE